MNKTTVNKRHSLLKVKDLNAGDMFTVDNPAGNGCVFMMTGSEYKTAINLTTGSLTTEGFTDWSCNRVHSTTIEYHIN